MATPPGDPRAHTPLKPVELHILLVLARRELYGYALVQEIEDRTDGRIRLEPGNLYRYLRRLEDDGLLEPARRRPSEEDPAERRRYYGITSLGRRVLAAEGARMRALAERVEAELTGEGGVA